MTFAEPKVADEIKVDAIQSLTDGAFNAKQGMDITNDKYLSVDDTGGTPINLIKANTSDLVVATADMGSALTSGIAATTTGATNTYAITYSPALSAYYTNMVITIIPNHTNTGAATLNINSLGAKNIRLFDGTVACVGNELQSGIPKQLIYDGTQFILLDPPAILDVQQANQASGDSTSSASYVDLTGMSVTVNCPGSGYYVQLVGTFSYSCETAGSNPDFIIYDATNTATLVKRVGSSTQSSTNGQEAIGAIHWTDTSPTPSSGQINYKIQWRKVAGSDAIICAFSTLTATVIRVY